MSIKFYGNIITMKKYAFKLSDTLMSQLEQTARIERALSARYFNENKNFDLTFNEFIILTSIDRNPYIHQRDLAKIVLFGTANLSRELDKLESKGLILRKATIKNKRVVKTISLTDLGQNKHDTVAVSMKKYINELESIYNKEEYKQFYSYLERLRKKLTESVDMIFK